MRPYVIHTTERPLTQVKYNAEGDLLFTSSKDNLSPVALFYADDGERVGTYQGHSGAVFNLDVTRDSRMLLTASADSSVRLWDVEKGFELFRWLTHQPARSCGFANADQKLLVFSTSTFSTSVPSIRLARMADIPEDSQQNPLLQIDLERGQNCSRCCFTDCDSVIVTVGEDGFARRYDVETGKLLLEEQIHTSEITDMQVSPDGTHAITSSKDKTAKIIDMETLQILRTYKHNKPVNSASMSPFNHVAVVGGQEAADVTTTANQAGGFDTKFFHKIYEEPFGEVRGHFGPVNSVHIAPDGKSFTTGGEDGIVRIQHFDMDYLTTNFFTEG